MTTIPPDEKVTRIVERLSAERWAESERYWTLRAEIAGIIGYYRTAAEYGAANPSLEKIVAELDELLNRTRDTTIGGGR